MMQIEKFVKAYHIRSYEGNKFSNLRLVTLMNILQDGADEHASSLGVGMEFCLAHGLAWVGRNYHIKINRMPKIHEDIELVTWPSEQRKLGAIRDFQIFDSQKNVLISASSQWVLIDFNDKHPVALQEYLPRYPIVETHALLSNFEKLPEVARVDTSCTFRVRMDDIDLNSHVNNAVYPLWASETLPTAWLLTHQTSEIEVNFRREGLFGETVQVITELNSEDYVSVHKIISAGDERELAKVRIRWLAIAD